MKNQTKGETKVEGYLILRKGDCDIRVADDLVRMERGDSGCSVVPSRAVCYVWSPTDQNRLRLQLLHFEAIPSKGRAEAFAIRKDGWELLLYRWSRGSFVVELWHDSLCVASVEWYNDEGLNAIVEGEPEEFCGFAEDLLTDAHAVLEE